MEPGSSRSTHYFSWQPASVAGQVKSGPGHVGIRRQSASRTGGPAVSSADMLASHQIGHFNTVSAKAFANSASEKLDTHCQNQRERQGTYTSYLHLYARQGCSAFPYSHFHVSSSSFSLNYQTTTTTIKIVDCQGGARVRGLSHWHRQPRHTLLWRSYRIGQPDGYSTILSEPTTTPSHTGCQ